MTLLPKSGIATKLKEIDDEVTNIVESGANTLLEEVRKSSESKDDKKSHLAGLIQAGLSIDEELSKIIADRMVEKGESITEAVKNYQKENTISPEKLEKLRGKCCKLHKCCR